MVSRLAAPGSQGNSVRDEVLRVHLRSTESETLGAGPAICVLASPQGDSDVH